MTTEVHRVSPSIFVGLAEGGGGASAARCLRDAQHSKHLLLLRSVAGLAASVGHVDAPTAKHAYGQLADVQATRPAAVAAVIRHPATGAWAKQTVELLGSAETAGDASPARMAALAAAAAIRSGTPLSADLPVADGWVVFPSLGRAVASAGRVRTADGIAQIDGARLPRDLVTETASWQGLRRLSAVSGRAAIELLIDDVDPYRAGGADHPSDRLSLAETARWQSVLEDAWDLLVRHHTEVAEETAALISVLTPLRPLHGGHVSATSRDTFGAILLSTPADATALAVTIAHEVQHAKLSALLDLFPLTVRDDERRFYVPWRDDPRPVAGLLQGAYAFLGVTGFWLRQGRLPDGEPALAEFARWLSAVRLVVDTLSASGQLTSAGQAFVSGMDKTLTRWAAEPVPPQAVAAAREANEEHREQWRQRNGEIPSLRG